MFLSKKLLIKQWAPMIQEIFSFTSASAASSTLRGAQTLYVGDDYIYYHLYNYIYKTTTNDSAASNFTQIGGCGQIYFSEAEYTSQNVIYIMATSNSAVFNVGRFSVNTTTEDNSYNMRNTGWDHVNAQLLGLSEENVWWANINGVNSTKLMYNTTVLQNTAGAAGFVGQPETSYALVSHSGIKKLTTNSVEPLFSYPLTVSHGFRIGGNYYAFYSYKTLYKFDSNGTTVWAKDFYCDTEQTVQAYPKIIGIINNKLYVIIFPVSEDAPAQYRKLTLLEVDSVTGNVLHTYDLPTPKIVQQGVVTLSQVFNTTIPMAQCIGGIKNKRIAVPLTVNYTKASVMYHNWFIITIPE